MIEFIGPALVAGLLILFFVNRRQRIRFRLNPNVAWSVPGFKKLQTQGFELWNDSTFAIQFVQGAHGNFVFCEVIKLPESTINVSIQGDSLLNKTATVEFRSHEQIIGKAVVTQSRLRLFDYQLTWRGEDILAPANGDIIRNGKVIGRAGKYGSMRELSIFAFSNDVPLETRAALVCLNRIMESADGIPY